MARSKPYPSLINITDLPVLQLVGVNSPVPGPYFHSLGCTMMSGGHRRAIWCRGDHGQVTISRLCVDAQE